MRRGVRSCPRGRHGLLMAMFETAGLVGRPLGFEPTRGGVGDRCPEAGFRRAEAPPRQVERIPAQTDPATDSDRENRHRRGQYDPADRGRQAKQRPHGNTRLSSSKCGPSRSVGQSPPQTMAVPWRAAAALKAAAMRG